MSAPTTAPTLLVRAVTGSHLYGLAHAGSDLDFYEVYDRLPGIRQARQTITGDLDVTRVGLSKFMAMADAGVPQALEVMFAPTDRCEVDVLADLRRAYRANVPEARATYARTIKNFAAATDAKRQRHARRLAANLTSLERWGRFDPTDTSWLP